MDEPLWEKGALFAGKYRVEALLGRGGMGVVLGARHARLDEPVAIKVLLPAMADTPGIVDRFLREARAAAKIKSGHVVRVTDVDTLPSGLPYIVMERLDGLDLAAVCRVKTMLPIEEAARYVVEACDAVAEAHARGIVHRDLKPANLFLAQRDDGSQVIKVLDFGISKQFAEAGEHMVTEAGVALGSPSYMSPEQMRSARDVDARTDIWALGAVLFRLLTGKAPFRAESLPELYTMVAGATLQRPSELRPDLPPGLEAVLVRCLEKDPDLRYGSVVELAEALLPFAGEGARAPSSGVPSSVRFARRSVPAELPQGGSPPRAEQAFGCDRNATTAPETQVTLAAGDSGAAARLGTPALLGARRHLLVAVAVAVAVALLAAPLWFRALRPGPDPIAAGAAPADVAAVRGLEVAAPPGMRAEPSPELVVVPAATVVASASVPMEPQASASAAAPFQPPRREPWPRKSTRSPGPAGDPFAGPEMSRPLACGLAVVLALTAASSSALARPNDAVRAAAQALFDDARQLAESQRWADACPKLAESQRLDPSMGTLFYLAECLERTGRIATAWTHYLEVADAARAAGLPERDRFARGRAEALWPRLPRLVVKVPAEVARVAGLGVKRDGIALGAAQWATAIPVDPGEHLVVASAPGKERWATTVNLREAASLEVTVPVLEDEHSLLKRISRSPLPFAGIVTGAVGLVGLGVGAGLGVAALDKKRESNADGHCDAADTCDATGTGLRRDSLRAATGSTIAFVAGSVAVAGGVVLVLVAPRYARGAPSGATVGVGVGVGSVSLGGRW